MESNIIKYNAMFTKKEVAKMLRCSIKTIERRVKLGLLKPTKNGHLVVFSPKDNPIINKCLRHA